MEQLTSHIANSNNSNCTNCTQYRLIYPKQSCSTVLPFFLLVIGVLESIISLTVLSRRSLKKLPLRASLLVLCVAALILLLLAMPRFAIMCHRNFDIRKYSLPSCLIHRALTDAMLQLSATTVAFISMERFLAIIYPYMIPQRRAKVEQIGLIGIISFCFLFNSHYFFTIDRSLSQSTDTRNLSDLDKVRLAVKLDHCHVQRFYTKWIVLLMSFVQTYIPFLVILISNIIIIERLYALKRKRSSSSGQHFRQQPAAGVTIDAPTVTNGAGDAGQNHKTENILLMPRHSSVTPDQSSNVTTTTNILTGANSQDIIEIGGETADKDRFVLTGPVRLNCRSREAKAAQLILFITLTFLLFNVPYECFNILLKHGVFPRSLRTTETWLALLYITYCYQLLVFPIYIVYHPVIRTQLKSWFVDAKQRISRDEMPTFEKQRTGNPL